MSPSRYRWSRAVELYRTDQLRNLQATARDVKASAEVRQHEAAARIARVLASGQPHALPAAEKRAIYLRAKVG